MVSFTSQRLIMATISPRSGPNADQFDRFDQFDQFFSRFESLSKKTDEKLQLCCACQLAVVANTTFRSVRHEIREKPVKLVKLVILRLTS